MKPVVWERVDEIGCEDFVQYRRVFSSYKQRELLVEFVHKVKNVVNILTVRLQCHNSI